MSLKVIGAGFGRTGTYSLKTALEQLGFGPCHHMCEVVNNPDQVRLWSDVATGKPDFDAIFDGYQAAVDFPTAACWQRILKAYPDAKVILSYRDAEDWYESFSNTILPLLLDPANREGPLRTWLEMCEKVIIDGVFAGKTDKASVLAAYRENEESVRALQERGQALIFSQKTGFDSLCEFLGVDHLDESYPVTNTRLEFHEAIRASQQA